MFRGNSNNLCSKLHTANMKKIILHLYKDKLRNQDMVFNFKFASFNNIKVKKCTLDTQNTYCLNDDKR